MDVQLSAELSCFRRSRPILAGHVPHPRARTLGLHCYPCSPRTPSPPFVACPTPKPAVRNVLNILPPARAASDAGNVGDMGLESPSAESPDVSDAVTKRLRALAPYLVSSPKQGIIGSSKYAERLRSEVVAAARDPFKRHVMVFGEPGLLKSNIATLIHFGGPCRSTPMVALDCSRLDPTGAELFGRGERAGLVEQLGEGTLLLRNVHKLPQPLLPKLVRLLVERTYRRARPGLAATAFASVDFCEASGNLVTRVPPPPAPGAAAGEDAGLAVLDNPPPLRRAKCRVMMTSNRQIPQIDERVATIIKVPPLRLRPGDVKDLQRYFLRQRIRRQAGRSDAPSSPHMTVTPGAIRQLENYLWPGNIMELQVVVERAVLQGGDELAERGGSLNEEVFWFAKQPKDRFRVNLLATYPPLRGLLRARVWPSDINFKFTAYVYPVVVAMLLWGPQDRLHNPALVAFWDYWWPLVFLSFPFLGRIWCAVCPFMIYGELAQRWRTSPAGGSGKLRKWPREAAERYGPPFLFSLFAAILVWEEVWDLPNTAALSGWLLLLITAGAVAGSLVFERRLWCRYLCPIGGMNGLMAKLSMTEVRAKQGVCSGECRTYPCYKGGPPQPPEGMASPGCPLYSHPAQLTDNHNCVMCMECLKACPNGSTEVRVRMPGSDLWGSHVASSMEVSLMFMLLGAVYLHHLPQLAAQFGLNASALGFEGVTPQHITVSVGVLAAPGLIAWGADTVARQPSTASAIYSTRRTAAAALASLAGRLRSISSGGGSGDVAAAAGAAATSGSAVGAVNAAVSTAASEVVAAVVPERPPLTPFLRLSYGYLPLVWGATLSHYLVSLLMEGGKILPVAAAMVGWEHAPLPEVEVDAEITAFLQGSVLLFSAAASAGLSRKLAAQPWSAFAPQVALIAAFTAELWYLILPR